jgi:hypothetical protein
MTHWDDQRGHRYTCVIMRWGSTRDMLAVGLAWVAYALFYLSVFGLVVGVPIGLLILLARVLLS